MSQELEIKHLRPFKNLLNFKGRQHLIYLVIAIILGILVNVGASYLIFLLLVYIRRFPKTYWIYFLCFIVSLVLYQTLDVLSDTNEMVGSGEWIGHVIEIKHQSAAKQTAIVEVEKQKIYYTTSQIEPKLLPGDQILINGELQLPMTSTIPHGFDFKQYLQYKNITYTLWTDAFVKTGHFFTVKEWQYQIASQVENYFPSLTTAYIKAWLLGMTDDLDEAMHNTYTELGIIHLFAISGLHVGLLMIILRYFLKRVGLIEELSQILVIAALILFIIISGASASIVRAAGMSILFILNERFRLKLSSLDVFSIIFLLNILINPRQVYQIGFIYSYWITFVLICFQSTLTRLKPKSLFFFLPFVAQLATLPIQLFFYYEVNILSYLVNLLIIPVVSSVLLPCLLLTLCLPFLSSIMELMLTLFETVIECGSPILILNWIVGSFSLSLLLGIVALFLLCCYVFEHRMKYRIWAMSLIMVFTVMEAQRFLVSKGQLTMLDVGQGDSIVIQSPYRGCNIVVDTGGEFSYRGESKEIFSRTLAPFLKGEGIRMIDYLILSHADYDHVGEAIALLQTFKVKEILVNQQPFNTLMKEIEVVANKVGTSIRQMKQGDKISCGNQELTFIQSDAIASNENDASLVFTVEMNKFSSLLTGDISNKVEADLLKGTHLKHVTLYKAAHHGSKSSNSLAFMKRLNPDLVMVSSGRNNRYGHPSKELIENAKELEVPFLNTQRLGSIQFEIGKEHYDIKCYPPYDYNIQ